MTQTREKFATQVSADVLATIRKIAQQEGRQLQALVDEALTDLIAKRKGVKPRPHVMQAYRQSLGPYADVYKKLAE